MKYSPQQEQELMAALWDPALADDLEQFVLFAYPWGKEGTPLVNFTGPRHWQRDDLQELTDHLRQQKARMDLGLDPSMFRKVTASGRGPGKSALVAWLVHWMMTTRIGSTTIITANTEPQLKTRTFAEITKWVSLAINAHWFATTVLSVKPAEWFERLIKDQLKIDTGYYYAQGQLWSAENPDAFAGVHNPLGVQVVMDEASGIPNKIFDVTEGFFTEPVLNRFWHVFSNPRNNSGAFYDAFHHHAKFWRHRRLDSRTVEGTDQALFARMIEQYGEDSDTVRVEVLGQFPSQGDRQFISNGLVYQAQTRELRLDPGAPLIMGMDVARFGGDENVVRFRQGPDARSIPPRRWKGMDGVASAERAMQIIDEVNPDIVNIDGGQGGTVIDILRRKGVRVNEVWFGSKADDKEWANKRTEMAARCREWLSTGCLDHDPQLFADLTSVDFDYFGKAKDQQILESKDMVKGKIGRSPDDGDALWLTFAVRGARRDLRAVRARVTTRIAADVDYPLFG